MMSRLLFTWIALTLSVARPCHSGSIQEHSPRALRHAFAQSFGRSGSPARAADATSPFDAYWSSQFGLPRLGGQVLALASYGGQLVAGGGFVTAGLTHVRHVAAWDGTRWQPLGSGVDGVVRALQPYAGSLVAAQLSTQPVATRNTIALWNGTAWSVIGTTDQSVNALTVFGPDLIAGGAFTQVSGVPAAGVARWDGTSWHALGSGTGSTVYALAVHAGGLVAAGDLPSLGSVAAWDGASWTTLGAGLQMDASEATVNGLVSDGISLYAAGFINHSGATTCNWVARWDGANWNAMPGANQEPKVIGLWQGAPVMTLSGATMCRWNGSAWVSLADSVRTNAWAILQSGTHLYVGSNSATIGASNTILDGMLDFDGTTWRALEPPWEPGMSGVSGVGPADGIAWNGSLVVTGGFSQLAAEDHFVFARSVAAWNGTSWRAVGDPNALTGSGFTMTAWQSHLIVGGAFSGVAGPAGSRNLAIWDGAAWSGWGAASPNSWVFALGSYGPDLIAAGYFWKAGSTTLNGIGRWDGTAWHSMGGGFNNSFAEYAEALAEWSGDLYAGGYFATIGGVSASNLARWNGSNWAEVGGGLNGEVYALTPFGGGLAVAGDFTLAGSVAVHGAALWDGVHWTPLGTNGVEIPKFLVTGNRLFAAGSFMTGHGSEIIDDLAMWNGSEWTVLGSGIEDNYGNVLAEYGGDLYALGGIGWANGHPAFGIARYTGLSTLAVAPISVRDGLALVARPNPAHGASVITYSLPARGPVRLTIHDLAGRRIATLAAGVQSAGDHSVTWDEHEEGGALAAPGVYLARLESSSGARSAKLVRIR